MAGNSANWRKQSLFPRATGELLRSGKTRPGLSSAHPSLAMVGVSNADAPNADESSDVSPAAAAPIFRGDLGSELKWYYSRLFPGDLFGRWLSYGDKTYLSRREISMTLPGDIYLRWRSFDDAESLVQTLSAQTPIKFDIGAVYNSAPRNKASLPTPIIPREKELVFDIDMTDYDDVIGNLAGGSEVDLCDRNWRYMATAVHVLDTALREDFGFSLIMWVYSGRRGIHCWIADARARVLTNEQRIAIAEYMYLRFEGRENAGRRQTAVTAPLHPSLARAKRIACEETFRDFVLGEQGMLDAPARVDSMLATIPSAAVRNALREKLLVDGAAARAPALEKWARIEKELAKAGTRGDYAARGAADYIMFKYTYPRLDINVSREINHLLKAPFCVHPKTGRVCVPFRARDVDSFRPGTAAPHIGALLAEINKPGEASAHMKEAVGVLREFVESIETDARKRAKARELEELDRQNAAELMRA